MIHINIVMDIYTDLFNGDFYDFMIFVQIQEISLCLDELPGGLKLARI